MREKAKNIQKQIQNKNKNKKNTKKRTQGGGRDIKDEKNQEEKTKRASTSMKLAEN